MRADGSGIGRRTYKYSFSKADDFSAKNDKLNGGSSKNIM